MFRTDELFSIIVDYPESLAALEDLKVGHVSFAVFDFLRNACTK